MRPHWRLSPLLFALLCAPSPSFAQPDTSPHHMQLVSVEPDVQLEVLFLVALGFIRSSIESWFSVQVESALESSLDMADSYYRESMAMALL